VLPDCTSVIGEMSRIDDVFDMIIRHGIVSPRQTESSHTSAAIMSLVVRASES
jgi:hypothetical protein